MNFAITGVGGFVAPRHLAAIAAVGGKIKAALDPHDSVGVLDAYGHEVEFFSDQARFARHLEELRDGPERIQYLTVCAPNDTHEAQCRIGLASGADVICEKPVVLDPAQLDELARVEVETGQRVWTVLQLRGHEKLLALRAKLAESGPHDVVLTYVTPRGRWYDLSWKSDVARSGGLAMNIGIHMFDLLGWLFGPLVRTELHLRERRRMAGYFEHARARVTWFLSISPDDLRLGARMQRTFEIDGEPIDFLDEGGSLHRRVYDEVLAGRGLGLVDARPCIETAAALRTLATTTKRSRIPSAAPIMIHPTAIVDEGAVIGEGTKVWHYVHVSVGARIGRNCALGQNVYVGPGVVIGDGVRIQNNVSVYEGVELEDDVFCGPSCVFTNVRNPRAGSKGRFERTLVRRGATLGANATIVCGGTVGRYAFIAAGAVVTGTVPDYALMMGMPARRVGWVGKRGERLPPSLVCPVSGLRYVETAPGVLVESGDEGAL